METYPKIAIIDDHTLFLKGIVSILSQEFKDSHIQYFESIKEFHQRVNQLDRQHLLISDIEIPGEDVFAFLEKMKNEFPQIPIIVLTMHMKLSVIRKCKNLNIEGYILKDDDDLLQQAMNDILKGLTFYSPRVEKFYKSYAQQINSISPREEDVIRMVSKGLSNKEIADKLFVSIETIKSHKKNIKSKLGISEVSDLVQYAHEHFLI